MPIATIRRLEDLGEGVKLTAKYKGKVHSAEVVRLEDGTFVVRSQRKDYKSPSAAAKAITGAAANGWVFWSREEDAQAASEAKAEARATKATAKPKAEKAERKPRSHKRAIADKAAADALGSEPEAEATADAETATEPERAPIEDAA